MEIADTARSGGSPAVHKAARILFELVAHPEPASPAELSRRLSLPKSSLADICATLLESGALVRDAEGRMRLGPKLTEIARGLVGGSNVLELFHGAVPQAAGLVGRTVVLTVLSGLDAAYLAVRTGDSPLPLTLKEGMRLPAWSTGTGRALLSTLPDAVIEDLHRTEVPMSPSGHRFELSRLMEAVARARVQGFASNAELGEMGLAGTAAVVYGAQGPVAAVGSVVSLAANASAPDADAEAVQALAHRLSEGIRRTVSRPES